jgi:hypothetical protein
MFPPSSGGENSRQNASSSILTEHKFGVLGGSCCKQSEAMRTTTAFLPPTSHAVGRSLSTPAAFRGRSDRQRAAAAASPARDAKVARARTVMIQRPDQDGPPDLASFFDATRRAVGAEGPPISVATGRARLSAHAGDSAAAAEDALRKAMESLRDDGGGEPQLCHCTFALDVDADAVAAKIRQVLAPSAPAMAPHVLARSVNKKDADGTIEVLLLRSDAPAGIAYAEAAIEPLRFGSNQAAETEEADADTSLRNATIAAAKAAVAEAVAAVGGQDACTFLVFAHTPRLAKDAEGIEVWASDSAVREGIDAACPDVIAYGGPAVGVPDTGAGWTLLSGTSELRSDGRDAHRVCVAAVPGSINFLISAVVKTWAQPSFTEPLSFMIPNYVGDASRDLLTSIRYDDWDRFIWCLEDQGVDVNVCWPDKQNQSPLLAACARVRTRMINYLIAKGANVHHRNAGNFTAAMYTRKLTEYDASVVLAQLKALEVAGLNTTLSPEDEQAVRDSGDGRIFLLSVE